MPQIETESIQIRHENLRKFCGNLLRAAGLGDEDATFVSGALVETNLRGIDSHGVARLPHYLRRIRAGSIKATPRMNLERLGAALARLDGGHGLGHVVMNRATDEAIDLARESGAGWVSVLNSSHCGGLFTYGLKIAEAGMIGIAFTHVDPMVLPFGASEPFCGTNPICLTAPGEEGDALCLDMASSVTPWNSVQNAAMEGVEIPIGWAVDAEGRDTTDPNEVAALYPFGGYKGSGLGLMIDVLCSMLSEGPYGPDIPKMYGDLTEKRLLGGLVGAIDISRFVEIEAFQQRLTEMMKRWGLLKPAEAGGRPLVPGEPERLHREKRVREGVPVGTRLIEEFNQLAETYRTPPLRIEPTEKKDAP